MNLARHSSSAAGTRAGRFGGRPVPSRLAEAALRVRHNDSHGPDAEQVGAQLDRILSSSTFAEAERARKFLRFIVEPVPAGRSTEIKESVIGMGRSFSSAGHNECCAVFSPELAAQDPRWIAYSSDETGQSEVYVKDFPGGDHRSEISAEGGWLPHWSREGRAQRP